MENRLQIAIQKSGRLTDHCLDLLNRCGLKYTRSRDELLCYGENMPIDILLVRDDDIPELVREGTCELGIAGQNVFTEERLGSAHIDDYAVAEVTPLDFGHCRLMTAGPRDVPYNGVSTLQGKKIATTYPAILKEYLESRSVEAQVVELSGSVEIAPRLGKADYICDLVSSGATLLANHLAPWETVFESEAVLLQHQGPCEDERRELIEKLIQRIYGVLQVKESKYLSLIHI